MDQKNYWQHREARATKQRQTSKHICADENRQRANTKTIIPWDKPQDAGQPVSEPKATPKLRVKPKRRAKTRRTSCVGGDSYREQFRQAEMTKKRDKRRGQVIVLLQSRVLGDDPEEIFRLWDTDGDGTLTRLEMKSGFDRVGLNLLKSDVDVLYDAIDIDNDGQVDVNEFSMFCKSAWASTPDPRFQYNKQLTTTRLEEDSLKLMADEKKVFTAQQLRRFQQQEAHRQMVIQKEGAINLNTAAVQNSPSTARAQGRVRQYLIDRDMRYELKAAQQKQQAKRKAFVEKHKKAKQGLSQRKQPEQHQNLGLAPKRAPEALPSKPTPYVSTRSRSGF
jgi:hypothetical protein